jgi:hypothetical protein
MNYGATSVKSSHITQQETDLSPFYLMFCHESLRVRVYASEKFAGLDDLPQSPYLLAHKHVLLLIMHTNVFISQLTYACGLRMEAFLKLSCDLATRHSGSILKVF